MPRINIPPIGVNNNNEHYKALGKRETKNDKSHDTSEIMLLFRKGTVAFQ